MKEILDGLKYAKKGPKQTAAFSLNADTLAKLREIAEKNDLSLSALVEAIISKALTEE